MEDKNAVLKRIIFCGSCALNGQRMKTMLVDSLFGLTTFYLPEIDPATSLISQESFFLIFLKFLELLNQVHKPIQKINKKELKKLFAALTQSIGVDLKIEIHEKNPSYECWVTIVSCEITDDKLFGWFVLKNS